MKKQTKSLYTNLYLNAAEQLNLDFAIIDQEKLFIKIFNEKKEFFVKGCQTQFNNSIGRIFAKNKDFTSNRLSSFGVPTPKFRKFKNPEKALNYALQCDYEIVIKPNNDSCANGVTIKPQGKAQIKQAIEESFSYQKEDGYIMIEEFIEGKDYRIMIFDNEVIAITYRAPSYVIGDGNTTIKELIAKKNKIRKGNKEPLISLRDKDLQFLKSYDKNLDSIPNDGEYIRLQLGCDRDIGGERHRIDISQIPEENINLFLKIPEYLKLKYVGIDLIIPDITKSYKTQKCAVNEVNSAPHQDVHYYDTIPGDNYSCRKILKSFFNIK